MAQDTFTSPGTHSWTAPSSQTITIECWGPGGGDADPGAYAAGSGGTGGYIKGELDVNDGDGYTVYVGGQGGNASGQSGGSGDSQGLDSGGDGGSGDASGSGGGGGGGSGSALGSFDVRVIWADAGGGGGGGGDGSGNRGGGGGGGARGGTGGTGGGGDATGSGNGGDGGAGGDLTAGGSGSDGGTDYDSNGVTLVSSSTGGGNAGDGKVVITYTEPPNAPSNLSATAVSDSQIDLSWTDNSNNENGFNIYRDGNQIDSVGSNTTSYSDTGLSGSTTYSYEVTAYNDGGESSGTTDSATTDSSVTIPTVDTNAVSGIGTNDATFNGDINDTGGENLSERGFVYDTSSGGDPGDTSPGTSGYSNSVSETGSYGTGTYSINESGLSSDTTYYVRAYGQNSAGYDYGTEVSFTTDQTPPTAPSNLSASASGDDISLSWSDNSSNEDGFYVYRAKSSGSTTGDYTQVADLGANTTTFDDLNLLDGEQYFYRVSAYNTAGESGLSNEDNATTSLTAPNNVSLDTSVEDEITATWDDNSDNEDGFRIFRSQQDSGYSQVGSVGANVTSFTDTGLEDGEEYYYYIQAYTEHVISDSTHISRVTLLPAPGNVSLDVSTENEATVSWTKQDDNSGGGFEIWRATQSGVRSNGTKLTEKDETTTSYTDTTVLDGERYWFMIVRYTTDDDTVSGTNTVYTDSSEVDGITVLPAPSNVTLDIQ